MSLNIANPSYKLDSRHPYIVSLQSILRNQQSTVRYLTTELLYRLNYTRIYETGRKKIICVELADMINTNTCRPNSCNTDI